MQSPASHVLRIEVYTAIPYKQPVEFIEASAFTKHVYDYLSEDEYLGLQWLLMQNPEIGKVVPGSGGVRKLRWGMARKGKSEVETIPAHVLRQIAKEINDVET